MKNTDLLSKPVDQIPWEHLTTSQLITLANYHEQKARDFRSAFIEEVQRRSENMTCKNIVNIGRTLKLTPNELNNVFFPDFTHAKESAPVGPGSTL